MSDIVERLRQSFLHPVHGGMHNEAADTIERLRAGQAEMQKVQTIQARTIRELRAEVAASVKAHMATIVERDKLRDQLKYILTGFSGPTPTPLQWKLICGKAKEVDAAIDAARREGK